MNDEVTKRLDRLIALQRETLNWIEILSREKIVKVAQENLVTEDERIVYHLSDGASSREIAKKAPVSYITITRHWKKWAPLGLVKPSTRFRGRFEKVLPLEALGLEVPKIEIKREKENEGE